MASSTGFDDWVRSPNIAGNPDIYELENESIERDGRLEDALYELAPWDDRTLLDIGCGTGFWLERYARRAGRVIGVEPDPALLRQATARTIGNDTIEVLAGSAESLPVEDHSINIVHARFAYFFGEGCEAGLAEVKRVLAPTGVLLVIDNSWEGGDFAQLLRASTVGNAAIDPGATVTWWGNQGALRHEIHGGWQAASTEELHQILEIEFPPPIVADFMAGRTGPALTYDFAIYEWRP